MDRHLEQVLEDLETAVHIATSTLASRAAPGASARDSPAHYDLAFLASEAAALRSLTEAAQRGAVSDALLAAGASRLLRSARARLDGRRRELGLGDDALSGGAVVDSVQRGLDPAVIEGVLAEAGRPGHGLLPEDLRLAFDVFRRFGAEVIEPHAEAIHRNDEDIPESILSGLAAIGAFGLSIPEEYGGTHDASGPGTLAMVVATEALSEASLGAGGSLITRPEILAAAVLAGGTEAQKSTWLPAIADGSKLAAVAVTEPDTGSDVAAIRMRAEPVADGWVLRGTKTWSTFAGRAELLAVLARTDPDPGSGHRGLSMFVVDKPRCPGREFVLDQPGGGVMRGRAIPTIGYRGMHSFELVFDGWRVAGNALVGEEAGRDRGFYLQLLGFGTGRLQTAARAVGTMQAAYDAAADYAATRETFGAPLITRPLMRRLLADMAVRIAVNRVFSYRVASQMGHPRGHLEASMVKALSCRAAESVTRDAMQVFGGYGYAEEYSVSRYFVDARVLSIFEGAEEVLALRVIAGNLVADAAGR